MSPGSTYSALNFFPIENGLPLKSNVEGAPRRLYLSIVHGWHMLNHVPANRHMLNHVPANLYGQYLSTDVFADRLRSRMRRNL